MTADEVLSAVGSCRGGLDRSEVDRRVAVFGPNAIRSHHASALAVLGRQLNSPLLWLLFAAAAISAFVGEGLDAMIIAVILAASVALGFVNEFRAERAAQALHSGIRHVVTAVRDGVPVSVEVTHLVPGDVIHRLSRHVVVGGATQQIRAGRTSSVRYGRGSYLLALSSGFSAPYA